jgi:hypothetical protein
VPELDKRPGEWCQHCIAGHGCGIYQDRPQVCRSFRCLWLEDLSMPDDMRPDRVGVYLARTGDCFKACVDDGVDWTEGLAAGAVHHASMTGHVIVHRRREINFVCGDNMPMPEKLLLDWTL